MPCDCNICALNPLCGDRPRSKLSRTLSTFMTHCDLRFIYAVVYSLCNNNNSTFNGSEGIELPLLRINDRLFRRTFYSLVPRVIPAIFILNSIFVSETFPLTIFDYITFSYKTSSTFLFDPHSSSLSNRTLCIHIYILIHYQTCLRILYI